MKNLFLLIFKRFRRLIAPSVLKRTEGLPWDGTDENEFDERFKSYNYVS